MDLLSQDKEIGNWVFQNSTVFRVSGPFDIEFEIFVSPPDAPIGGGGLAPALFVLDADALFPIVYSTANSQAKIGAAEPIYIFGIALSRKYSKLESTLLRLKYLTPGAPPQDDPGISAIMNAVEAERKNLGWSFQDCFGGADEFLTFLETSVIPELAAAYPIDRKNLGIIGHSAAGAFVANTLLSPAASFQNYIIGTFATGWFEDIDTKLETFLSQKNLERKRIFHGVGGEELTDQGLEACKQGWRLIERIAEANRGDISVEARIFEDENHASVVAHIASSGIRVLYGKQGEFVDNLNRAFGRQ